MDDDNKRISRVTGCATHRDPMGQSYSTPSWTGSTGVFRLCAGVRFASPRACYLAVRMLTPGDGEGLTLIAAKAGRISWPCRPVACATPRRAP